MQSLRHAQCLKINVRLLLSIAFLVSDLLWEFVQEVRHAVARVHEQRHIL